MEQYDITGMTCAACAARVEKAALSVEGVKECSVNLLTNSMGVSGDYDEQQLVEAVEKAGYGAMKKGKKEKAGAKNEKLTDFETPKLKKRLATSLCFLLILMYFSMGHGMFGFPVPEIFDKNPVAMGLLQLLLTVCVMVINQRFFVSGFKALFHRAPNMDTLVSLGASASFIYSTAILFVMSEELKSYGIDAAAAYSNEFYFESAAMILTLITLGKMLEARSKGKTTDALKGLMALSPDSANVIRGGKEISVPVSEVMKDDTFILRPGDRIPVDGMVISGGGAVDESSLTGESVPSDKEEGSGVYAGTVNMSGYLECRATEVGEDTALSKIIKITSDAAATKAPIAKIADKVSGVFVPVVMIIALVTSAVWLMIGKGTGFALARGISVLVISCPCALGLATPVAIMVGSGVGAKNGILFKTAVSLENTGKAQIAVFDKTGTVTEGKMKVTDIIPVSDETELLTYAYSLEKKSGHPLAKAIVEYAEKIGIKDKDAASFAELRGSGVEGYIDGKKVFGGSVGSVSKKTEIPDGFLLKAEKLAKEGKTPLAFGSEDGFSGLIGVFDSPREDSREAVEEFGKLGIKTVMLTGDNGVTASEAARQTGIDEVIAGVFPDVKAGVITKLKEKGKVAMVGDGINDAPALTSADTGMAIGAGTDVAIDSADVVLMKSSLRDAVAAIRISRATLRNIKQNLFWAFFYNTIGIPLAAGVFIPLLGWEMDPMFGAAAMSLSSFCVVSNALRLNLLDVYSSKHDKKMKNALDENAVLCENIISEFKPEDTKMERVVKIEGMMCTHCSGRVKKALEELPFVSLAEVSHEKGEAKLTLSGDFDEAVIKKTVEDAGYKFLSAD